MFEGFDVWRFFGYIGEGIVWFLGKIVDLFFGIHGFLVDVLGGGSVAELSAWVLMIFVILSVAIIVFTRGVNLTQSNIENFSHGTMGLFMKIVAIVVVIIAIVYILPNIEI